MEREDSIRDTSWTDKFVHLLDLASVNERVIGMVQIRARDHTSQSDSQGERAMLFIDTHDVN